MDEHDNRYLLDALAALPPAELNYQDWCSVGMALKQEGYDVEVWDDWSRSDSRYHPGECAKKWNSFRGAGTPVTGGTIVQLAKDRGWSPVLPGGEIGWDDSFTVGDDFVVVDRNWLEERELPRPIGDPVKQLITYLETLFDSSDLVGYVTQTWEKDGRYMPQKGNYDRTAGQLIEELSICDGDIGAVVGDYDPKAGAWIRFNPLDGQGVRNDNVTAYNFALVESDTMPIGEQYAVIQALELPVACLVHSGGKSLHAIVRVDATNYQEYQKRVDYLYQICAKNGLTVDRQNRNPSRLSRMPGIVRGESRQELLAVKIGKGSWAEWKEWVEAVNDDLPDTEHLADVWNDLPPLAPPLIEGILRQGHKMLLAGPSKAGKSFALIELAIAIAEGGSWLGLQCAQGQVLYVNLELDKASCFHRFRDVYTALGVPPNHLENIDIWNLRGRAVPLDKLTPKLIRRASKRNYLAIIIDPIYKIITGDENSADQMAAFCNQFDKVCTELGCAVIYCHHHSKGAQGSKRSMDRASGSGVFARDPDALLDMIELELTEDVKKQQANNAVCRLCGAWLERFGKSDQVSPDDLCSRRAALDACMDLLSTRQYNALQDEVQAAEKRAAATTAWRIEATLREFMAPPPRNLWFRYPVHQEDASGVLGDLSPDSEKQQWQKNFSKKKTPQQREAERANALDNAYAVCSGNGKVTVKDLREFLGVTVQTLKKHVKESGRYWTDGWSDNSEVGIKQDG